MQYSQSGSKLQGLQQLAVLDQPFIELLCLSQCARASLELQLALHVVAEACCCGLAGAQQRADLSGPQHVVGMAEDNTQNVRLRHLAASRCYALCSTSEGHDRRQPGGLYTDCGRQPPVRSETTRKFY